MKAAKVIIEFGDDGKAVMKASDTSASNRVQTEALMESLAAGLGSEWTVSRIPKDADVAYDQSQRPRFDFFNNTPADAEKHPPLISSFQSLETCFALIALDRYPHALISCAAAIESALKAKLAIPQKDKIEFYELVEKIGAHSGNLGFAVNRSLQAFRDARNTFTHFGFSPHDDDASVALLLQVGFPYLKKCYRELFGFYLDYRELAPTGRRVETFSEAELVQIGLPPQMVDQMRVALEVNRKVIEFNRKPAKYCISTFAQYLGYVIKSFHRTADAEFPETFYGRRQATVSKESMSQAVRCAWQAQLDDCLKFDCSICNGNQTLVAQCDERGLLAGNVRVRRAMCIRCGLSIPEGRPFLADVFLGEQIEANQADILRAFSKKGTS